MKPLDNFKNMDEATFLCKNISTTLVQIARTNVEYLYVSRCLPSKHHF